MATKFFLDAENGALAFQKLQDYIDQDNGVYLGTLTDALDPNTFGGSNTLNVKNVALAALFIRPSVSSETYDFTVYGGIQLTGDALSIHIDMSDWYVMDSETGATGNKIIMVDCRMIDYLTVFFPTPPGTDGTASIFPIPYEVSE